MQNVIFWVAIFGAIGCFLVYLVVTLKLIPEAQKKTTDTAERMKPNDSMAPVTAEQVAEIVKALASLAESLAKAGPALWSLIGSLLFLLIAAMSAGLIVGGS